jgi:hypothetical protein
MGPIIVDRRHAAMLGRSTVRVVVVRWRHIAMKTDEIRTNITDIVFIFIFMFGFGFEYG